MPRDPPPACLAAAAASFASALRRGRRGAEPPWGTGAARSYRRYRAARVRSCPEIPEPPGGTRAARSPPGTDPPRWRSRSRSRRRRSPLLPTVRRCLPLSPGRRRCRGARPGGLRAPRPAAGGTGTGTAAGEGRRFPPTPPQIPAAVGDLVSSPPSLQSSSPAPPKYLLLQDLPPPSFLPRVLLSSVPRCPLPSNPRTYMHSSALTRPLSPTRPSISASRGAAGRVPLQLSPLWGAGDPPPPPLLRMPHQQRSVPLQRHSPTRVVPPPAKGDSQPLRSRFHTHTHTPLSQVSPPLSPCHRDPPIIRAAGRGRSARRSKQDPKLRVGRDAEAARKGGAEPPPPTPPVYTSRGLPVCSEVCAAAVPRTRGSTRYLRSRGKGCLVPAAWPWGSY